MAGDRSVLSYGSSAMVLFLVSKEPAFYSWVAGEELASVPLGWLLFCLRFWNRTPLREPTLPYIAGRVGYKSVWILLYGLRALGGGCGRGMG